MNVLHRIHSALRAKRVVLKEKWNFHTNDDLIAPVAISTSEGLKIFIGTKQGKLTQLNQIGAEEWSYNCVKAQEGTEDLFLDDEIKNSIVAPPTLLQIGKKEFIIIGTESGNVFCIGLDGKLRWQTQVKGGLRSSALVCDIDKDGELEVIFAATDKKIYILSHEGKLKSSININQAMEATPIFMKDLLIVATAEGTIYCLTPKGELKWKYKTKDKITANIVPAELYNDAEWYLLVGSHDRTLYALSLDGELKWSFETKGAIVSEVITAHITSANDKDIVFGASDNKIYCVSAHGELRWSFETDFWVISRVALITTEGLLRVVAGSYDQHIYVLDAQGNESLNYLPGLSGIVNQPGYSSIGQAEDIVQSSGKKLNAHKVNGNIVGCVTIPNSNDIIINTRQGNVYGFTITEE